MNHVSLLAATLSMAVCTIRWFIYAVPTGHGYSPNTRINRFRAPDAFTRFLQTL